MRSRFFLAFAVAFSLATPAVLASPGGGGTSGSEKAADRPVEKTEKLGSPLAPAVYAPYEAPIVSGRSAAARHKSRMHHLQLPPEASGEGGLRAE